MSTASNPLRVAVIGGGSFGTAIANVAAENGCLTHLWMRNEATVQEINETGINNQYLPQLNLSPNIKPTSDLETAVTHVDLLFVAIPSSSYREVVANISSLIPRDQMVISLTKGIEPVTFSLMSEVLKEELPHAQVGVLGGPNLAKEMARKALTATVIASESSELRQSVHKALGCSYFRVYANDDVHGVELGGALKNIYAIMAGIASAKGFGGNSTSMLMTRALAEMSRFAVDAGANPFTFLGLAGVGDLIATCSSPLSRNFRVGQALGEGQSLEEAIEALGEVAEGVNTLTQIKKQADEREIYMPLAQGLYQIVHQGVALGQVITHLMTGEQGSDVEFVLSKSDI